jgi:signal transduction histidine kinase
MRSAPATALTRDARLPDVLRELVATAAAVITREGDLRDANAGFLRIAGPSVAGDVRDLFVNPRFDQFAARTANASGGALYRGILNIADPRAEVHSLSGAVYAVERDLLVIGEPDVDSLQTEIDALRSMNRELALALRGRGTLATADAFPERLQRMLGKAGVIAAEADAQLRYRCIAAPHAELAPGAVVGKRDDEIEDSDGARSLTALKERVLRSGRGTREAIAFERGNGLRVYDVHVDPLHGPAGDVLGVSSVALDVTDWARAQQVLQEADRHKDAFLATLAHELRSPLAALRTGLDLITALRGDAAACERPLGIMDRQIDHLARLVDDLLDVSRISRGKLRLRKERLGVAEIIGAALEISVGVLGRGGRELSVGVPASPLSVTGDRVRLVQVLCNLLNNAAKFTDEGGRIAVRVEPAGAWVHIRVQDDGRGIPRAQLADVFEMFSQAEPGRDGGLGIGLTLVRSLVAMHGGRVSAESGGPGCGATFTVSLPLCSGKTPQPRPQ